MSSQTPAQTDEPIALLGNDGPTYLIDHTDEPSVGGSVERSRVREVLSGASRTNPIVTFLLAALATAAVVGPLWWRAADVPPKPAVVLPGGITVVTNQVPVQPLHDATISDLALIRYVGDRIDAVAFTLSPQGGEPISERVDTEGPDFDLLTDEDDEALAFDTTRLVDGVYELLVAVTDVEGNEALTAALFRIDNSG